jgi:hypothetical protein
MKKMKIIIKLFFLLCMVKSNAQDNSRSESNSVTNKSIFQNEFGEIKLLELDNQFQSLSKPKKSNKMKAKKNEAFKAMQEKMAKKQGKASPVSKKANTAMAKMKGKAKY